MTAALVLPPPRGPFPRVCVICRREYMARRQGGKYCTKKCQREAAAYTYGGRMGPYDGLSTGTVGALHELVVSCELMRRGYQVFRALSPSCPCDLIVLKEGKCLRIEVTTGYRSTVGNVTYPRKVEGTFDHIAVVLGHAEIVMFPPLPDLALSRGVRDGIGDEQLGPVNPAESAQSLLG